MKFAVKMTVTQIVDIDMEKHPQAEDENDAIAQVVAQFEDQPEDMIKDGTIVEITYHPVIAR